MGRLMSDKEKWYSANLQIFWGEIAPCDHLVQFYETDSVFLNTLEGFAGSGLLAGDCVVIVATQGHLRALNERLRRHNFDLDTLMALDHYIPLDAKETLNKLMVNQWPDEKLFDAFITGIFQRAGKNKRKVRAFGEMVAVLWEEGLNGATVQLENLWHQTHCKQPFMLYCAYPKSGFTQCANDSLTKICKTHSKVIDGSARPATEIYYRGPV
jgi:hypothetical protein